MRRIMIRKPYKRKPDNHSGEGDKAEKSTWDLVDPQHQDVLCRVLVLPRESRDGHCMLPVRGGCGVAARHWPRNQHRAGSWTERERSGCSSQWEHINLSWQQGSVVTPDHSHRRPASQCKKRAPARGCLCEGMKGAGHWEGRIS